jgi:hypothetical protein
MTGKIENEEVASISGSEEEILMLAGCASYGARAWLDSDDDKHADAAKNMKAALPKIQALLKELVDYSR